MSKVKPTVQSGQARSIDRPEDREEAADDSDANPMVAMQGVTPARVAKATPSERANDPVRLYLREISSVNLLSREGEVAIARRIEAGRWAMIAGLCESPLTFQAIVIWRDELNAGKIFLRDIIDVEATYGGPGAKAIPTAIPDVVAPPVPASTPLSRIDQIAVRENWTGVRAVSTTRTTTLKTRCRSPPSRPNSSPRCWQRSIR